MWVLSTILLSTILTPRCFCLIAGRMSSLRGPVRSFNAVCTEGIISGDFITQELHIDEAERTVTPRRKGSLLEPLALELKSFIGALQGKTDESLISAPDATNVTRVAESAILSSKTGSPIYLELK